MTITQPPTGHNRAMRVIQFLETLKLPDGKGAGEPLRLRDWQKEIIYPIYGVVDGAGKRIVRQAVLSLARKNAKTALVAGLSLCHLCGPEAVKNGQLYSLSIDREQAGILFNYAKNMVYMDDELSARLNVTESRKHLVDPVSGSIYSVLSGEKKGKMGKSSSFLAFDELAEFGTDRTLYDALLTSTGAHDEPMIWVFSTQAPNDVAVLSQLIDYGLSEKGQKDTKFKCFLYSVPNDVQDIYDEKEWYKANPALGDFRSLEEMRDFASKAKFMPTMEMTFRNLYLNQRVGSADQFISPDMWKLNAGEPDLGVFEDKVCYGGLDLSAKNDLTALVIVAKDDAGVIHVLPHFWTPKDGLAERARQDGALYELWVSQGFLNAVPGKVIDYKYVAGEIGRLKTKMNLKAIKFDRWRIEDLVKAMDEMGVDAVVASWEIDEVTGARKLVVPDHDESAVVLIPHGQGYRDMNPAVERVEDAVVEGRLRHGGHPVLTMCAMNTRIKVDPANGRKFDKIKSTGRIDGLVAMAMAIGPDEDFGNVGSVYETRGVLTF